MFNIQKKPIQKGDSILYTNKADQRGDLDKKNQWNPDSMQPQRDGDKKQSINDNHNETRDEVDAPESIEPRREREEEDRPRADKKQYTN